MRKVNIGLRLFLGFWLLFQVDFLQGCDPESAAPVAAAAASGVVASAEALYEGAQITEYGLMFVMMFACNLKLPEKDSHNAHLVPAACLQIIRAEGRDTVLRRLFRENNKELYFTRIVDECKNLQALNVSDAAQQLTMINSAVLTRVASAFIAEHIAELYLKSGLRLSTQHCLMYFLTVAVFREINSCGLHAFLTLMKQDLDSGTFTNARAFLNHYDHWVALYIPEDKRTKEDLIHMGAIIENRLREVSISEFLKDVEADRVAGRVGSKFGRGIVSDIRLITGVQACNYISTNPNTKEVAEWFENCPLDPKRARSLRQDGRLGGACQDLYKAAQFLMEDPSLQEKEAQDCKNSVEVMYQTLCCAYANLVFNDKQDAHFKQALYYLIISSRTSLASLLCDDIENIMKKPEIFRVVLMNLFESSLKTLALHECSYREKLAYRLKDLLFENTTIEIGNFNVLQQTLLPLACLTIVDRYPNKLEEFEQIIDPVLWNKGTGDVYGQQWKEAIAQQLTILMNLYIVPRGVDRNELVSESTQLFLHQILTQFSLSQMQEMWRTDKKINPSSWLAGSPLVKHIHGFNSLCCDIARLQNPNFCEIAELLRQEVPEALALECDGVDPEYLAFAYGLARSLMQTPDDLFMRKVMPKIISLCADLNSCQDAWSKHDGLRAIWSLYKDPDSGFSSILTVSLLQNNSDTTGLLLGLRNFMLSFSNVKKQKKEKPKPSVNEVMLTARVDAWKNLPIVHDPNWVKNLPGLPTSFQYKDPRVVLDNQNLVKIVYKLLRYWQEQQPKKKHDARLIQRAVPVVLYELFGCMLQSDQDPTLHCVVHTLIKHKDKGLLECVRTIMNYLETREPNFVEELTKIRYKPLAVVFLKALPIWLSHVQKQLQLTAVLKSSTTVDQAPGSQAKAGAVVPAKPVVDDADQVSTQQEKAAERQRQRLAKLESERAIAALLAQSVPEQLASQSTGPQTDDLPQVATMSELRSEPAQALPKVSEPQNLEQSKPAGRNFYERTSVVIDPVQQQAAWKKSLISKSGRFLSTRLQEYEIDPDILVPDQKWDINECLKAYRENCSRWKIRQEETVCEKVVASPPTVAQVVTAAKPALAVPVPAAPAQVAVKTVPLALSKVPKNSEAQGFSKNQQVGNPAQAPAPIPKKVVGAMLASEVVQPKYQPKPKKTRPRIAPLPAAPVDNLIPTVTAVIPAPLPVDELSVQIVNLPAEPSQFVNPAIVNMQYVDPQTQNFTSIPVPVPVEQVLSSEVDPQWYSDVPAYVGYRHALLKLQRDEYCRQVSLNEGRSVNMAQEQALGLLRTDQGIYYADSAEPEALYPRMNSQFPWTGKPADFDNFQASIKPNGFDGSGIFGE